MSCNRNGTRAGRTAGIRAGIGQLGNQAANVAGSVVGQVGLTMDAANGTINRAVAPLSNRLLAAVDRPAVMAGKVAPFLLTAAAVARGRLYLSAGLDRPPAAGAMVTLRSPRQIRKNLAPVRTGHRLLRYAGLAGVGASLAAGLKADEKTSRTLELTQGEQRLATVNLWKSERLTRFLNRRQLIGSHAQGKNVVSSEGELVAAPGATWHRGTSVVKTPQGRRTLTHLQSLTLPATAYYFDRSLSDAEVAGLVTGQAKPQQMAGYVGEISKMENLAPAWAMAKRALITNRLYWPSPQAEWSPRKKEVQEVGQQQVTLRPVKTKSRETARELPERR